MYKRQGKETQKQVGEKIRKYSDCGKALLVYGSDRIKRDGLFDQVAESLKAQGIEAGELGGVKPNPRLGLVREGIEICRKEGISFILAVGGGSVIDTAKAIGVGVPYEGDVWDFFLGKDTPKKTLMTAAVCTIPAAGSESSLSAVIDVYKRQAVTQITIQNCYSRAEVTGAGTAAFTAGFVGNYLGSAGGSETISNCYNTGKITTLYGTAGSAIAGSFLHGSGGGIKNCYWDSQTSGGVTAVVTGGGATVENCSGCLLYTSICRVRNEARPR